MKKTVAVVMACAGFSFFLIDGRARKPSAASVPLPYKNPALPTSARVKDLLSRMTLEEKAQQLQCVWSQQKKKLIGRDGRFSDSLAKMHYSDGLGQVARPSESLGSEYDTKHLGPKETALMANQIQRFFMEKTRLGIPVMFHEESLHGNQALGATHFPSHLAMGATWDEALLTECYTAVAKEVRLRGGHQVLAPVVDLGRDPRWGRTEETLGEDPLHVARMAVAEVRAYQGNGKQKIDKDHVACTLKHFGVHGQPENGCNIGPAFFDERTLRETFFPPFEACIKAGALSVMPCYNELNGVPAHANKWLLTDLLRKEWGFRGIVTSDYMGIGDLKVEHFVAKDSSEAALLALGAGVDIETPYPYAYGLVPKLVREGKLPMALLDATVARILTVKFELGLFENPYTDPEAAESFIGCAANRKLALRAAEEAVVLLKDKEKLLPLDVARYKTIAVIGPNADRCILGGYSDKPKQCSTPLEGIRERAKGKSEVLYAEGCRITDKGDWFSESVKLSDTAANRARIQQAVEVAQKADVVLLFVGGNEALSREAWSMKHHGDLADLELMSGQNELAEALRKTGKPIVAILNSGPPLTFKKLDDGVGTILQAWYMGQEGGTAIANILFGDVNPGGKLPISIARSVGHLPSYYNHKPTARLREYAFDESKPLYPFGHGLSYTRFAYSKPIIANEKIKNGDSTQVSVEVENVGDREGAEVVQCYVRDEYSSLTRPVKELKDFARITLKPGEKRKVSFTIGPDKLSFFGQDMKRAVEPGTFKIMVGTSSVENQTVTLEVKR